MLLKRYTMPTVLLRHPPPSLQFIGSQKLPPPKTNKKEKLARHGSMLALAAFATHNDVDGCPSLRLAMLCYVSCALPCALCPVLCRVSWVLSPVPPRRVSSPDHAVFPPHRTFEVWAKWHAVYCWRVLELRSPRSVPTGWFVEREIIMPSSNTERRARSTEYRTRS